MANDTALLDSFGTISEAQLAELGWTLKPEGLCQDDTCVLVPDRGALVSDVGLDLAVLGDLLDRPVAVDTEAGLAAIGAPRATRRRTLDDLVAPDFTLPDQNGDPISLASLRGKKVVLYFYPKDDTPGCTKEACNFRDRWEQLKAHNITVLGISKDGATSHNKFINKHELPFTLLTDEEPCAVASLYESYGLKKFMGREYMGMMRHTFLIDEEGKLERIYLKVKAATMADTLISDLDLS